MMQHQYVNHILQYPNMCMVELLYGGQYASLNKSSAIMYATFRYYDNFNGVSGGDYVSSIVICAT